MQEFQQHASWCLGYISEKSLNNNSTIIVNIYSSEHCISVT